MNSFTNDLSQGSVTKKLIRFAAPFLVSSILQNLYSIVDMIIVGQFAGVTSLSAVTVAAQISLLLTNFAIGLSTGGSVLIGQYVGSKDNENLKKSIGTFFSFIVILVVALMVIILTLHMPLLRLVNAQESYISEARSYLLVNACGMIFMMGYNAVSSVLRALGDSVRPLIFVAIACVANIVFTYIFVAICHFGAAGAALGTIMAQAISVTFGIVYLKRNSFVFDFKLRSFKIDMPSLKKILRVGLPSAVQNTMMSISFTILSTVVNSLGAESTAAMGTMNKLVDLSIIPSMSMMNAISAMTAQNVGAQKFDRALKTLRSGLVISYTISIIVFILMQAFPTHFIKIFNSDPTLVPLAADYCRVNSLDFLFAPGALAMAGLLIGSGHTLKNSIITVSTSLLIRAPLAWLLGIKLGLGLKGVAFATPTSSLVAVIAAAILVASGTWKTNHLIEKK
ncbi:MAG: MATE family efflux transporter [Oscillospiraceae bacterium]|nr:MATE family efflux transporter [Oscillospiraceae bacterium]